MLVAVSKVVPGAHASCFVSVPCAVLCVLNLAEKLENEDFLELRLLPLKKAAVVPEHVDAAVRKAVERPLHKTQIVIDLVVLSSDSRAFETCVNAASICLLQSGVPLVDTFAAATVAGDRYSATIVGGVFTEKVVHLQCQGDALRNATEEAWMRCKANADAIKKHLEEAIQAALPEENAP